MTLHEGQIARAHGLELRDPEHPEAGWRLVRNAEGRGSEPTSAAVASPENSGNLFGRNAINAIRATTASLSRDISVAA
jgi:hypothetical protein